MKLIYTLIQKLGIYLSKFGTDRYLHFIFAYFITFFIVFFFSNITNALIWVSIVFGMIIVGGISILKEYMDKEYTDSFDILDLIFSISGIIMACISIITIDKL